MGYAIASIEGPALYLDEDVDDLSSTGRHDLEVARELELLPLLGITRWSPRDPNGVSGEVEIE